MNANAGTITGETVTPFPALSPNQRRSIIGVLIGTAVGDALGLPMEGNSPERQRRLFAGPLRHRLCLGRGMVSDDTEHTFMLAQSLIESGRDVAVFRRSFARRLRWWLLSLPAGVGFATFRAVLRLWVGVSPSRSGVRSAGNGPAMRSAILGVLFADSPDNRRTFVNASTVMTHRDWRAEAGALAVAETAAWMSERSEDFANLSARLRGLSEGVLWARMVDGLSEAAANGLSVADYATKLGAGRGVSGYIMQSVPVAIYAAVIHANDFRSAVSSVIACGGDTDTVGAITGALVGARVGEEGIPVEWRTGICDWPRSLSLLRRVGERLSSTSVTADCKHPVNYSWWAIPWRNLVFLLIVLAHGFRRLLPPY